MIDMNEIMIDDESLERIVEIAEEGHELTDDELAWLMQDKERLHVYRDMLGLRRVVEMGDDTLSVADTEEAWRRFSASEISLSSDEPKTNEKIQERNDKSHSLGNNGELRAENVQLSTLDPQHEKTSRFPLLTSHFWKVAAVLLLLVGTGFLLFHQKESSTKGYVAFEHNDDSKEVMIDCGNGQTMTLDQASQSEVRLTKTTDGERVLDYQAIQDQGLAVAGEVESHTVTIPRGKDFRIVLADGTQVWLYADSRITYPSHFVGAERRVVLHGQAYFKVAKDEAHPFVIHTDQLDARVLGTELNVRSYERGGAHVALINGKVEVRASSRVVLRPGQGVTLTDDGKMDVKEENMDVYTYWRSGYIYFDNSPLADIVQALGHWYNVNVVFENKQLMEKQLRFFCQRSEPLSQAVDLLNDFGIFHVELNDNTLTIK